MSLKVVYIGNNDDSLTKGKVYDVIKKNFILDIVSQADLYFIQHDNYGNRWFNQNLFLTLEEYRDKKLNELLK